MTTRGNDLRLSTPERDRRATALFAVGLAVVAVNSALYFFDAESLSHPFVSVLGVALLLPLYLQRH